MKKKNEKLAERIYCHIVVCFPYILYNEPKHIIGHHYCDKLITCLIFSACHIRLGKEVGDVDIGGPYER